VFEEIFSQFQKKNNGIKAIGVWGKDGLELEKKYFPESGQFPANLDLDFSGAELADIISKLSNTRLSPGVFFFKLQYHNDLLLIFSLTHDYFLLILTNKDIIEGKLKFYFSIYKDKLISAL